MFRRFQAPHLALSLVLGLVLTAQAAWAQPTLTVSPTTVEAGDAVFLTYSGYTPGGYPGTIRWDGVDDGSFPIPPGGSGTVAYILPSDATPGGHDITLCAACDVYEFEQSDTARVTVVSGELGPNDLDIHVKAIEVTQGVRGDIPTRTTPGQGTVFPSDTGTHVANRRTMVRVYPWVEAGSAVTSIPWVSAQLWANAGGTIYGPITPDRFSIRPQPEWTLEEMRGDLGKSLNFTLPDEWTQLAWDVPSLDVSFVVEINPGASGECSTCDWNNTSYLNGVDFEHVGLNNSWALRFRPFLMQDFDADGMTITNARPTLTDLQAALMSFQEILPIADGIRGIRLHPWRNVDWVGPREDEDGNDLLDIAMIRRWLPTGTLEGNPPNDYYAFLYDRSWCAGHAFLNTPYLISNTCGAPSYVVAHELSHAIGRPHAGNGHGEAGGGGYDVSYPMSHGQVEPNTFGVDVYNGRVYPPELPAFSLLLPEELRHDYMSYGPYGWVSQYTWDKVAEDLGSPSITPKSLTPVFLDPDEASKGGVRPMMLGGLYDGNTMKMHSLFSAPWVQVPEPASQYNLHFLDANGQTLEVEPITAHYRQDGQETSFLISQVVEVPDDWAEMRMFDGQTQVSSWTRSSNPPTVEWLDPQPWWQLSWPSTGTVTLKWTGQDADGDNLHYRIYGLNGQTNEGFSLAMDVFDDELTFDLSQMPGAGTYEIRVEASDGFDTAWSSPIYATVEPSAPQPLILFPQDGSKVLEGCKLRATGVFADFQDDEPNGPMEWYLDGQLIGTGNEVDLSWIQAGFHTLELRATNSWQLQSDMVVQFESLGSLGVPGLISPPANATVSAPVVPIEWEAVDGATSYRLQIAEDPDFEDLVMDISGLHEPNFDFVFANEGTIYYWRTVAESSCLQGPISTTWSFQTQQVTSVDGPRLVKLDPVVAPNPFNPNTSISFSLGRTEQVAVDVFDLQGRRVSTLFRGSLGEGSHSIRWNGTDGAGRTVSSGVYLARVAAETGTATVRMTLVK